MRPRSFAWTIVLTAALAPGANADPFRPGIQDQIRLGQRAKQQVEKEYKLAPDSDPRVVLMRSIGERLVAQIPEAERKRRPFPYSFGLVQSKEVNAFALPGGPVYFFSGLVDRFETEDQLAGVLAHEIVHVRNQHWASAYADNTKRQLGIAVVLSILGAGSTAFDVAGVADALLFELPYSRKHETESDTVGYDLMVRAGFHPEGMAQTFEMLGKISKSDPPEWISTHPADQARVKRIRDMIAKDRRSFAPSRPLSTEVAEAQRKSRELDAKQPERKKSD